MSNLESVCHSEVGASAEGAASVLKEDGPKLQEGRKAGVKRIRRDPEERVKSVVYRPAYFVGKSGRVQDPFAGEVARVKPKGCPSHRNARSRPFKRANNTKGGNKMCEVCGKIFKTRKGLARHLKVRRPKECKCCGAVFRYEIDLDRHERRLHPGFWDAKWSCEVKGCNELIHGKKRMDAHLKKHHGDQGSRRAPWKCEECGKGFFHVGNLKAHKKDAHKETVEPDSTQ